VTSLLATPRAAIIAEWNSCLKAPFTRSFSANWTWNNTLHLACVGTGVGTAVGVDVGVGVGAGESVGESVGAAVGAAVGDAVGTVRVKRELLTIQYERISSHFRTYFISTTTNSMQSGMWLACSRKFVFKVMRTGYDDMSESLITFGRRPDWHFIISTPRALCHVCDNLRI
jgi:hypothetical protein